MSTAETRPNERALGREQHMLRTPRPARAPGAHTRCMVAAFTLSVACGRSGTAQVDAQAVSDRDAHMSSERTPTFHRDVRPLLDEHCASCHMPEGIAPFSVGYDAREWQKGVPNWLRASVAAVQARTMPPWMPDPSCREMLRSRRLRADEVQVFVRFRDGGYLEGSASDYVAMPVEDPFELGPPTLSLASTAAYTPDVELGDDYRCFLLPHEFVEETYLIATDVVPQQREEVHHVLLYRIDADSVAGAQQADGSYPGPGYTCFENAGVTLAEYIGGWVPGATPLLVPTDAARVLPAGSRIVMQIHYHTTHLAEGARAEPDRTVAKLWLMKPGAEPRHRIDTLRLSNTQLHIAAGDAHSVQVRNFSVSSDATVVGVRPHMHALGSRVELTLAHGASKACIVRIPAWDVDWQATYAFATSAYVHVTAGDELTLTCEYDNSRGARDVHWGARSSDEMCSAYLDLLSPFR